MAGVTETGFVTKRFPEVIEGLQEQAIPLFQDLVQPGETVDTSASTTLGRLIGLTAPALTEVWEAMQEVYAAFDPNTSYGVALDNLVALGGVVRQQASPTLFSGIVWGDTYTEIPRGSLVRSSVGNTQYESIAVTTLIPSNVSGIGLEILSVSAGQEYLITLSAAWGNASAFVTATGSDTAETILNALGSQMAAYTQYNVVVQDGMLVITSKEHYSSFNVSLAGNIVQTKTAKRAEFASLEVGVINTPVNSVNTIVTPILGWDSVNNPIPATPGSLLETDEELRERFRASKYIRANNTRDSLYSGLLEIDGVQYVRVYTNDTDLVDAIGLPPHSFMALVLGGADTDIAKVVWNNTPLGIASHGGEEVVVVSSQNLEQVVKFSRPQYTPIYVEVSLQTYGAEFPVGGEEAIKQALVDYVNSNQTIGGRVIYSRLFDPVNSVPGHEIEYLKIGTDPLTLAETSISLAYDEIATLDLNNITIVTA